MKPPPNAGFSILEILVATAILALLLVAVLQITGQTTQVARAAGSKMSAEQSVRSALDAVERDVRSAVISPRATVLVRAGSPMPDVFFVTRGRGPNAVPTRFLGVCYSGDSDGQLIRRYESIGEGTTNLLDAAESALVSSSQPVVAENLLQVAVLAILDDGTRSLLNPPAPGTWNASGTAHYGEEWHVPSGWVALVPAVATMPASGPRVSALLVAIVGTDAKGFALLTSAQRALFEQPSGVDPVSEWEAVASNASLPAAVRASLSIQSLMIPLP